MADDGLVSREWLNWFNQIVQKIEQPRDIYTESIVDGKPLTKSDDTNVTLTLGGTPATALLKPVSLTLGWTGQLGLARGGTHADLSATGGAKNYLKQASVGADITVGTIPASDIVSGAALTRVNDTNVTLTLGGTPASALLVAASLTLGWTGTLSLARGGTGADLSATGGTKQYVKQATLGGAFTVGTIPASDIASGAALTKTDDTNVTLTLGGTPTTALLAATSLALGWTGTLDVTRGGTGTGTAFTSGSVVFAGASGVFSQDNANFSWDDTLTSLYVGNPKTVTGLTGGGVSVCGPTGTNASLVLSLNGSVIGYFRANGTSMLCRGVAGQLFLETQTSSTIVIRPNTTEVMRVAPGGVSLALATPTAILHLKAGTTAASTAPLKFNSGSLLTTAEAGAIEFLTDDYYATITTGAARKGIILNDGTNLTSGKIPVASTNGRLIDGPTLGAAGLKIPAIQAEARSTAQTAAVASVATYTLGASDGSVIVSANVNVTTSTLHSFSVQVAYTDETNTAQTLTMPMAQLAGTLVTLITNTTGAGPYEGVPLHLRCKASTAITVKTTGTFTTVTYNVEGAIQQIA